MRLDIRRYELYQSFIFFINVVIFFIGLNIYLMESGTYGKVIYNETQEWNNTVVLDIVTSSAELGCPPEYSALSGEMLGTAQLCSLNGNTRAGYCETKGSGKRQRSIGVGIGPSGSFPFQIMNSNLTCVKRGDFNYFDVVRNRVQSSAASSCLGSKLCGPQNTMLDVSYCYSGASCPINHIIISQNQATALSDSYIYHDLGSGFQAYLYQDMNYSPITSLAINLGSLCGDVSEKVSNKTDLFYVNGSCSFKNEDGSWQHPNYIDTGLYANEYLIATQNYWFKTQPIWNRLKSIYPSIAKEALEQYKYRLYAKSYASWKSSCNEQYDLGYVQDQASHLQQMQGSSLAAFVVTGVQLFQFLITMIVYGKDFFHHTHNRHKCWAYYSMISSVLLFIAMTWFFILLTHEVIQLNQDSIQYYIDHNCTNDFLLFSYKQVLQGLGSLKTLTIVGLLLTLICTLLDFWSIVHSLNAQHSLFNCFRRLCGQKVVEHDSIQEPLIEEEHQQIHSHHH